MQVVDKTLDARNEWDKLGLALNISSTVITSIRNHNSVTDRFIAMLEYWLQNGSNTTWTTLAHALGHPLVARADLMNKIANEFSIIL